MFDIATSIFSLLKQSPEVTQLLQQQQHHPPLLLQLLLLLLLLLLLEKSHGRQSQTKEDTAQ